MECSRVRTSLGERHGELQVRLQHSTINIQQSNSLPAQGRRCRRLLGPHRGQRLPSRKGSVCFGHGGWNSFETNLTEAWLNQIDDGMRKVMPAYYESGVPFDKFPRLFLSPHAQGVNKPGQFAMVQNNIKLAHHERFMSALLPELGIDHLGAWNLTIQATSPDGTHCRFEDSIVKAMMIINWLSMLKPDVRWSPDHR